MFGGCTLKHWAKPGPFTLEGVVFGGCTFKTLGLTCTLHLRGSRVGLKNDPRAGGIIRPSPSCAGSTFVSKMNHYMPKAEIGAGSRICTTGQYIYYRSPTGQYCSVFVTRELYNTVGSNHSCFESNPLYVP